MQMQAGLIEQQNSVFVSFFGLDQKHKIERKEPLEALAAAFKLDVHAGPPVVRDPDAEIVAVSLILDGMPALPVPFVIALGDIQRGGVQLDRALFFTLLVLSDGLRARLLILSSGLVR